MQFNNYSFILLLICSFALIQSRDFYHSDIYFGVDNEIERIDLNENEVHIKKLDLSSSDIVKRLNLVLFPGDEIKFQVSKSFNLFNSQPGLAVTINYVDQKGNKQVFNSGEDGWICNQQKPERIEQISTTKNWKAWKNSKLSPSAYVIWGAYKAKVSICTFSIPKHN